MTELILSPENGLSGYLRGPADELDAIGDYSSAAVQWSWKHDNPDKADDLAAIVRLSLMLVFRDKTDVIAYGALLTELPVGIGIQIRKQAGATIPWFEGNKIRSHVDLGMHAGAGSALQIDADTTNKNSEGYVLVRLGTPEGVRGIGLLAGDEVQIVLNDDFSDTGCKLVMHRFAVNGFYCPNVSNISISKIRDLISVPDLGWKL